MVRKSPPKPVHAVSATPSPEEVVEYVVAEEEAKDVRDYVGRGRRYEGLGADEMEAVFVDGARDLAGSVTSGPYRVAWGDAKAEYEIRGVRPPYHLIREEIDTIVKAMADAVNEMSAEERSEMESGMLRDYERGQKGNN